METGIWFVRVIQRAYDRYSKPPGYTNEMIEFEYLVLGSSEEEVRSKFTEIGIIAEPVVIRPFNIEEVLERMKRNCMETYGSIYKLIKNIPIKHPE
jgi:hypothetical protein